jgi:hypothetical protein
MVTLLLFSKARCFRIAYTCQRQAKAKKAKAIVPLPHLYFIQVKYLPVVIDIFVFVVLYILRSPSEEVISIPIFCPTKFFIS